MSLFERVVRRLCRTSLSRPWLLLGACAALCVPAASEARRIRLDTDLKRLLPEDSLAVRRSHGLESVVGGDGGYFSVLFEGPDHPVLVRALDAAAARISAVPAVGSVETRNAVEFIRRYKYLLVSSDRLREVQERIDRLEREVNPFVESLEDEEEAPADRKGRDEDLEREVKRYLDLPELYQSEDGRIVGMLVRPRLGITSLGATRDLCARIEGIAAEVGRRHGVWAGVSGSLRNKVDIYTQIREDLNRSGTISTAGILLTLVLAFRGPRVLPVVLLPLLVGLLWSYGLVPTMVGDLNTITSFLLMVLFGMGVEFSIHLVKRFQHELRERPLEDALFETFRSTGRSILTSGFATTLGMAVLMFSAFRGFSEFGIISATSILAIFLSMFVVLPPALVLGTRSGLVRPRLLDEKGPALLPPRWVTAAVVLAVLAGGAAAGSRLSFDYDFANLQAEVPAAALVKEKHRAVFSGVSAPAAVYAARDLPALDAALDRLRRAKAAEGADPVMGTILSVRDVVPEAGELTVRRELLADIQDRLRAPWTGRVKDQTQQRWIRDIREFVPPEEPPALAGLPDTLRRRLATRDDSGGWIVSVDTAAGRSKDGRVAMTFTRRLYDLVMPEGVDGPTGDKPVLAEILWIVTSEGPWLVGLTFAGIVALVFFDRRSAPETAWVVMPLAAGLLLTLGGMVALGWKLNFFNIVVLPNLIGNAVDNGVHYFRRWIETGLDTRGVQRELAGALSASAGTTVMGYLGMAFAHHAGLRSIGLLAVLGLGCCWFTGVVLMPGTLDWLAARRRHRVPAAAAV
jgi:predicted RND superfamily exporter protein